MLLLPENLNVFDNAYDFSEFCQEYAGLNKIPLKDFILQLCDENGYDIEELIPLITPTLKERMMQEHLIEIDKINVDLTELI